MSTIRPSKGEARTAEAELLGKLRERAGQLDQAGGGPATVRALLEAYAARLAARGKSADTIGRAASTALAVERLTPGLLDKPVGAVTDGDVFAFRQARVRGTTKPATINRDLRTLPAALKAARPDYRFPAGAFFKEDNTRVRWLRPEDELLLFASLPQPFRDLAQLAVLTLMRLSEVRLLRRDMVRLEQGVILLPRPRAGRGR
jgi:integrase